MTEVAGPKAFRRNRAGCRVGGRDARRSPVSRFLPPDTATLTSSAQGPSQPFIDSAKRCTGESLQSQGSPGSERRPPDSEFTSRTRRPAARGGLIDWAPVGCTLEASDPGPVAGPYYAIDVVTSLFTAQLGRDLSDDEYREVQAHLMDRPDAGARSFPFRTGRETRSVPDAFSGSPAGEPSGMRSRNCALERSNAFVRVLAAMSASVSESSNATVQACISVSARMRPVGSSWRESRRWQSTRRVRSQGGRSALPAPEAGREYDQQREELQPPEQHRGHAHPELKRAQAGEVARGTDLAEPRAGVGERTDDRGVR